MTCLFSRTGENAMMACTCFPFDKLLDYLLPLHCKSTPYNFSCVGLEREILHRQDGKRPFFPAWIANHNTGFP